MSVLLHAVTWRAPSIRDVKVMTDSVICSKCTSWYLAVLKYVKETKLANKHYLKLIASDHLHGDVTLAKVLKHQGCFCGRGNHHWILILLYYRDCPTFILDNGGAL